MFMSDAESLYMLETFGALNTRRGRINKAIEMFIKIGDQRNIPSVQNYILEQLDLADISPEEQAYIIQEVDART